ncbi:MAG: DUF3098 domain-containing protein [candidate division Zixibacteria bacterium]|nr:DUF3098 domain-containing protein [candidate division Zixibacteria bacterium]
MADKAKKTTNAGEPEMKWPFGRKNYILFAVAMVVIIIGFYALGQGSITLAPILLILGYCVLIPISLIVRDKSVQKEAPQAESAD